MIAQDKITQELSLYKESIRLESLAIDVETQRLYVSDQAMQKAREYYQVKAELANQDLLDQQTTLSSATNLLQTLRSMHVTIWSGIFDFINMGIQKFSSGFSTAISSIILGTKTAKEAFADFGNMMVQAIVEFVVQWGVQAIIALTIGKLIEWMIGGIADSIAAMWMPSAILASIATFGGAAAAGTAAVAGALGTGMGLLTGIKAAQPVPIAQSAEGNIFTRPALTTIAEKEPEGVFPLSKLPLGNTVQINVESPIISSNLDIADFAEQLGDFIKRELRMG